MDLVNYEFYSNFKRILNTVDLFRDIHVYFLMVFFPHKEKIMKEDPKNVIYKVDKGVDILNLIFNFKRRIDYLISTFPKGISEFYSVKNDMIYLINKFNPKASSQYILKGFLVTLMILIFN